MADPGALLQSPYFGNAETLGGARRGWFMGHFMPPVEMPPVEGDGVSAPLHTHDIEVKWATHAAGESRNTWGSSPARSLSLLIRGRFRIIFRDSEILLGREGDFALWNPHVEHTWHAEEDSVILTVRWPSQAQGNEAEPNSGSV